MDMGAETEDSESKWRKAADTGNARVCMGGISRSRDSSLEKI
jgi:hypothetical protein